MGKQVGRWDKLDLLVPIILIGRCGHKDRCSFRTLYGHRPARGEGDQERELCMKFRMSLIFCALVVILVSMVWVVRDRGSAGDVALTPAVAPAPMMVQTVAAPLPAVAAT